jgi:succinylglutamate desuccinylase
LANKVLFICATHGDEGFSIPVLKELEKTYPKEKYNYDWIIGNPFALKKQTRFVDCDLNRSAPGNLNALEYENRRAAEIREISKQYDIVIDIHGTKSNFGVVKIIPYPTYPNLILASYFSEKRNVIWYSKKSKAKGPLVQFMHCPAIELECGDKTDPNNKQLLKRTLSTFLETLQRTTLPNDTQDQEFYLVYGKVTQDPIQQKDFVKTTLANETFYPFLTSNGYKNTSYYKMGKVTQEELFDEIV